MTEQEITKSRLSENAHSKSNANASTCYARNDVSDLDAFLGLNTAKQTEADPNTAQELSRAREQLPEDCHLGHSAGPTHLHVDESGKQHGPVQPDESIDDCEAFQAVLHGLGVRAQHALAHGRVQALAQFMLLQPEAMMGWPNTGGKTVAEIVNAQERLRELVDACKRAGRTLRVDEVCVALGRPVGSAQKHIERPVLHRSEVIHTQIVHGPDEPKSWSVLTKTIPDLLSLDDHSMNGLLAAAQRELIGDVTCLPEDDCARLSAGAIYRDDQLDIVLFLTLGYLVGLGVSIQSVEALASVIATRAGCTGDELSRSLLRASSNAPIVTEAEIAPIHSLRVDSFNVPRELVRDLTARKLVTWGDLISLTERNIIEGSEGLFCAVPIVSAVWRMKWFAQQAVGQVSGLPPAHLSGFESMMQAYLDLAARTPRDRTLLQGRMGLLENRKWTLDELGNLLGLTRERVRQIELKCRKALRTPSSKAQLAKFWVALDETLRIAAGVCTLTEAAEQIAIKMEWDADPHCTPLASLLQLSDHVYVDRQAGLVRNRHHRCHECESVVLGLESLFAEDRSERTLQNVIEDLLSLCARTGRCARFSQGLSMSEGFLQFVAQKTDGILAEGAMVYCRDTWGSRRGSRVQLVESILRDAGQPMHFSEVYQEVRRLMPDDKRTTEHNVHSWLGRTDTILLWDRGTFVHCNNITVPTDVVAAIESWLVERLGDEIPFISVAGAYAEYEDVCSASGVTSESALYSCLRRSANAELCYPRYPQIYLSSKYESRIPAVVALEQYIEDAHAEVTYDALREYAVDDLCLKEFQFQQFICQLSSVTRTSGGGFLHLSFTSNGQQPESARCRVPAESAQQAARVPTSAAGSLVVLDEIDAYVKQRGLPGCNIDEVVREIGAGKRVTAATRRLIDTSRDLVVLPKDRLVHRDNIVDIDEAAEGMLGILNAHFTQFDGYSNHRLLFEAMRIEMSMFINDNGLDDVDTIYLLAKHLFCKESFRGHSFCFSQGMHIWKNEPNYPQTLLGLLINHARNNDGLLIRAEAEDCLDRMKIPHGGFRNIAWMIGISSNSTFLKYDQGKYILSEALSIGDGWVREVKQALGDLLRETGFVVPRDIRQFWFKRLPPLPMGLPWTHLLLQDVIEKYKGIGYRTISAPLDQSHDTVSAAIVPNASAYTSFADVVSACLHSVLKLPCRMSAEDLRLLLRTAGMIDGNELIHNMHRALDDYRFAWSDGNKKVLVRNG